MAVLLGIQRRNKMAVKCHYSLVKDFVLSVFISEEVIFV